MQDDDKPYYRGRAADERRKSIEAGDTSAGKAHELLAELCDKKADGDLPWLQVVRGNSSANPSSEDNRRDES